MNSGVYCSVYILGLNVRLPLLTSFSIPQTLPIICTLQRYLLFINSILAYLIRSAFRREQSAVLASSFRA